MPTFLPRPVRYDNDVFAGRRSVLPRIGQVEEVPSNEGRPDALPPRTHVADRAPGDPERPTVDHLGVAIVRHGLCGLAHHAARREEESHD